MAKFRQIWSHSRQKNVLLCCWSSRVEEKVELVHRNQAEADTFHLFDLIKDYVALIGAIREALNERNKAFQTAQNAQVQ